MFFIAVLGSSRHDRSHSHIAKADTWVFRHSHIAAGLPGGLDGVSETYGASFVLLASWQILE